MYLDSVKITEIQEGLQLGFIKGVTSNPTLLLREGVARSEQIERILETKTDIVFVQLVGETVEELKRDYQKIKAIKTDKDIGIKVPLNFVGLTFIHKIKEEYPEQIILGTGIYSADQGIMGSMAGCDYLAPYVNRMENNNIDPNHAIYQMRTFIDERSLSTKIMGASFKNSTQVIEALTAGAHTVTVPMDILKAMTDKQLATSAIQVFNSHGKELNEMN